jgi:hypothetical protein
MDTLVVGNAVLLEGQVEIERFFISGAPREELILYRFDEVAPERTSIAIEGVPGKLLQVGMGNSSAICSHHRVPRTRIEVLVKLSPYVWYQHARVISRMVGNCSNEGHVKVRELGPIDLVQHVLRIGQASIW